MTSWMEVLGTGIIPNQLQALYQLTVKKLGNMDMVLMRIRTETAVLILKTLHYLPLIGLSVTIPMKRIVNSKSTPARLKGKPYEKSKA